MSGEAGGEAGGEAAAPRSPGREAGRPPAPPDGTAGRHPLLGAALILAAASLWGTLGIFGRALYAHGLTPVEVASARTATACLLLGAWLLLRRSRPRLDRRQIPLLVAYGAVFALFEFAFFAAVQLTDVAVAVALLYTAPAFVVLLAWASRDEPADVARLLPLALVLAGVFLVTGAARAVLAGTAPIRATAALLGLGAGLGYGVYIWLGKRALRGATPIAIAFWGLVFGAVALALAAPPWTVIARHTSAIPLLLGIGVGPTVIAYLLYLNGLRFLPASTVSMLASIEPVVAALLGLALLGEAVGWDGVAGIALVVAASVLLARRRAPVAGH